MNLDEVDAIVEGIVPVLAGLVRSEVAKAVEGLPRAEAGAPGKDADPELIRRTVAEAIAALPAPKDGAPGKDGTSVTLAEIRVMLEGELAKWALDFERRAQDTLQRAIERMPRPKDGADGFSLEDFDVELADDRTLAFRFARGEVVKERKLRLPQIVYRGAWEKREYERGDIVTKGGSMWHSQVDANADEPGTSPAWRLCVRRGKDGNNGGAAPAAATVVRLK